MLGERFRENILKKGMDLMKIDLVGASYYGFLIIIEYLKMLIKGE